VVVFETLGNFFDLYPHIRVGFGFTQEPQINSLSRNTKKLRYIKDWYVPVDANTS
jgi:hypothetical protein